MCTMGNIYFYILLICAVQHSFATNEKKTSEKSNIKLTEKYLEEEAISDIENLLLNIKENNNKGGLGDVTKNSYEPMSIYAGNENLKKQVDNLLKRLDIKKRSSGGENDLKALRSGIDEKDENIEDLTPSARYKQFINNLDLNHRDAIKSRMQLTVVGDSKFDDMFKSDKNNRFKQLMKKLGSHSDYIIDNKGTDDLEFINKGTDDLEYIDKTLRQRLDYTDIKPGIHTTIFINNDKNSDKNKPYRDMRNQQGLMNKLDKDDSRESKPLMRAHYIPQPDNYGQSHDLRQNDLNQGNHIKTNRETLQMSGNNIGMRNEFWKQIDLTAREKRNVPLPPTTVKVKNYPMDELQKRLDANQRQGSKFIGDSLRFHDLINQEYNDELPRVPKTPDGKYIDDIGYQFHPDRSELQQKITTNRIEGISDDLHRNNFEKNEHTVGRSDIMHRDDGNDLLLPGDNNYWKKLEQRSKAERKEVIHDLVNPDTDWDKLLKRFSVSRLEEVGDVLHPKGQQKIERKLDINYREDKNDKLHPDVKDDWKFLEYPDIHFRADSVDKKLPVERTLHITDTYNNRPQPDGLRQVEIPIHSVADSSDHHDRRTKRSAFTQAGYTQDPDICKLYNENLIKLWSNLTKYINATEQPSERALHNIAVMIEAYLEHQNLKQSADTVKVKHDGTRDKITEVTLKIKKLLDESEASSEKITKIITKYIKPFYGDVENKECQQVNEESLSSSVELLYKNYVENIECKNEGEGLVRNKKLSLRKHPTKSTKAVSSHWHSTNTEFKSRNPEIKSILSEDELYKDFHRGKMPRQRPATKNRRVLKHGKKPHSLPAIYRSGDHNINGSEKLKTRSKASHKSSNRKLKKSSRKSDLEKNRCEKYAIRKLTVSLRPVIERFMALLECQLDNTLRSISYDKVSMDPYYLYASKFYSNEDSRREKKNLPRMKITRKHTERSRNISPRKFQDIGSYDISNETEKDIFTRDGENGFPWIRKYGLDQTTGMNLPIASSNNDMLYSNSNPDNNKEYTTVYNEYFQSPPLYDDYDGIYTTHLSNHPSLINPLISVNKKKNGEEKIDNTEKQKNSQFYEDDMPEEPTYILNVSDQKIDANVSEEAVFNDLTKLKHDNDNQIAYANRAQRENTVKKLESITDFLRKARDESLQTPEFAVPFALDSNKGYVELTHLVKYPKMLMYRPQFIVKNTMPYDDFLKTVNNFNMTNDKVRLMKIVRHLPDSSVKVLFETEDFESPLEVRNIKDYRRSGYENYPLESKTDTVNKNTNYDENTDFMDENSGESLITVYHDEVQSNFMDILFKSDESRGGEDNSASNMNLDSNTENNSTLSNSASNSTSDSGSSLGLLPSLVSGLGSGTGVGKVLGSTVGSQIGSNIGTGLDKALGLGSTFQLNPIHSSQLSSYLSKLLPTQSDSQSDSNLQPSLNSQLNITNSASNSQSPLNSLLSSTKPSSGSSSIESASAKRKPESDSVLPSSTQIPVNQWWKLWKDLFKQKIKNIVGNMASLAENIDHIIKR